MVLLIILNDTIVDTDISLRGVFKDINVGTVYRIQGYQCWDSNATKLKSNGDDDSTDEALTVINDDSGKENDDMDDTRLLPTPPSAEIFVGKAIFCKKSYCYNRVAFCGESPFVYTRREVQY